MKRFISMVLVVVMIFTLIPINSNDAYAVQDIPMTFSSLFTEID